MAYRTIGVSVARSDGPEKVTGTAIYTADLQLPNMAHGKLIRSPHAHARIRSIDVSEAMKTPGVFAVATSDGLRIEATGPAVRELDRGWWCPEPRLATIARWRQAQPPHVIVVADRTGACHGSFANADR